MPVAFQQSHKRMPAKKRTFAFVFARGGSKGLPGKNLLPIEGIPLLAHSIRAAKEIAEISEIFVSTDSQEIAESGLEYGANIIIRPDELSSDTAPEWLAWQHAITFAQTNYGNFNRFLSLPPTSPCRYISDVINCLNELTDDVDLVLTKTSSQRSPWFNMVKEDKNGFLRLVNANENISRRQDAPSCFDVATIAYAAHVPFIMNNSRIWDGQIRGIEVSPESAIDIDTKLDYYIARFIKEEFIPSQNVHSHE